MRSEWAPILKSLFSRRATEISIVEASKNKLERSQPLLGRVAEVRLTERTQNEVIVSVVAPLSSVAE